MGRDVNLTLIRMAQVDLSSVYQPQVSAFDKLETLRYASQQIQRKLEACSTSSSMRYRISSALESFNRLASDWDSLCEDVNESYETHRRRRKELSEAEQIRIRGDREQEALRLRKLAVRSVSMELKEQECSKSLVQMLSLTTADVDLLSEIVKVRRHNRDFFGDVAKAELAELDKEFTLLLANGTERDLKAVYESQFDVSMMNESEVNAAFDKVMDELSKPQEAEELSGWVSDYESESEDCMNVGVQDTDDAALLKCGSTSKPTLLGSLRFDETQRALSRTLASSDSRNFNAPQPLQYGDFIVTSPRSVILAELEKVSSSEELQLTSNFTEVKSKHCSIIPLQCPSQPAVVLKATASRPDTNCNPAS